MSRPEEPESPDTAKSLREAKPFRPRDTRRAVARALGRVLAAARESGLQVKVPDHLESPALKYHRAAQNLRQALSGESASQVRTIEGILAEARIEVHRSAPGALSRAQEALSALDAWTVPPALRRLEADLRAEVLTQVANAHRVLGAFEEATKNFALARSCVMDGSLDPLVTANLDAVECVHLSEEGKFDRAHLAAQRAGALYTEMGNFTEAAICRIRRARNYYLAGRLQLALEDGVRALSTPGLATAPSVAKLVALGLLYNVHYDLGNHHRALILNRSCIPLAHSMGLHLAHVRARWCEGVALHQIGEPHRAIEVLEEVRRELLDQGLFEEAVNATLDLALAHSSTWHGGYTQGRMAREMLTAVNDHTLSEACTSAFSGWASAALAGRANREIIEEARHNAKRWNANARRKRR